MTSRRNFFKAAGLGLVTATTMPSMAFQVVGKSKYYPKLGVAGYSFVNFNLDESLKMMQRMGIKYLCIKDFHLPYKSTAAEIKAFHGKLAAAGVTGYAVGPIYVNKSRQDIDDAFDYAQRVGVDMIVGIPQKEDLTYLAEKAQEYKIRFAIHNHGPEDKLYPNATVVYNDIKDLNSYIGLCFDMGHNTRDGQDSVKDLRRYGTRIFDMHLKNVTANTAEGKAIELGRGVIPIPEYIKALQKINYQGVCSMEFEKDMRDPLAGMAESAGYFRGVADVVCK